MDFDQTTDEINELLEEKAEIKWSSIPGSLVKISSSSAGFIWGYNSINGLYFCPKPANGLNWIDVPLDGSPAILDLTVDANIVYVLTTTALLTHDVKSPEGDWTSIPASATKIFGTHSYIWAQDGSLNKQKCPKPCNMPNWIVSNENKIRITSSDDMHLFGVDSQGNGYQTDELMSSAWTQISGISKVQTLLSPQYFLDMNSQLFTFEAGSDPVPLDTDGYIPLNIEVSDQLWMTSTTSGTEGNIFNRPMKNDYTAVMGDIAPLDRKREATFSAMKDQYKQQTLVMTVNEQIRDVISFFAKIIGVPKNKNSSKESQKKVTLEIDRMKDKTNQMEAIMPKVYVFLLTLIAVALTYLSVPSEMGHILALLEIGVGFWFVLRKHSKL